jgi:predicted DCC family thiol-disulfide oxidoreductase YuxK
LDKQVIVYDGECRFCQWSIRRIQKLDKRDQFEYLPRQTDGVAVRFPRLEESDFNTGLRFVSTVSESAESTAPGDESIYVGSDAIYEIYRRMPPLHLITWFYRVPVFSTFFRACYGVIARNRHLFGKVDCDTETCGVDPK